MWHPHVFNLPLPRIFGFFFYIEVDISEISTNLSLNVFKCCSKSPSKELKKILWYLMKIQKGCVVCACTDSLLHF